MSSNPFNHAPQVTGFSNSQNRSHAPQQASQYNHAQQGHVPQQPPQYNQVHQQGHVRQQASQYNHAQQQGHAPQQKNPQANTCNNSPSNTASNQDGVSERDYTMFPVYSKRAALQFKPSETRKSQGKNFSFDTIMIEGANRINPNDRNDKRYDWQNKLSVQIMLSELPIVIAVFLGIMPSCQFMNHGQNNDKGFSFERQGDGLFGSVFHKGGSMAVKLDWPTTLNIGHFMLSQYTNNFTGLSSESILRNINRMCQDMDLSSTFPLKNKK